MASKYCTASPAWKRSTIGRSMRHCILAISWLAASVLIAPGCSRQLPSTPSDIASAVKANSSWMANVDRCPEELMDREEVSVIPEGRFCDSSNLSACLARCIDGEGPSCYWLSQNLQSANSDDAAVAALFQRSCKLGVASGCTNRAAMMAGEAASQSAPDCAQRTFDRACAMDDPWGCTMFAFSVTQASSSESERKRALAALEKSCLNGNDDPACTAAEDLKEALKESTASE